MSSIYSSSISIVTSLISIPGQSAVAIALATEKDKIENRPNRLFTQIFILNIVQGVANLAEGVEGVESDSVSWVTTLTKTIDALFIPAHLQFCSVFYYFQLYELLNPDKKYCTTAYYIISGVIWSIYLSIIAILGYANEMLRLDLFAGHRMCWIELVASGVLLLNCALIVGIKVYMIVKKKGERTIAMKNEYRMLFKILLLVPIALLTTVKTVGYLLCMDNLIFKCSLLTLSRLVPFWTLSVFLFFNRKVTQRIVKNVFKFPCRSAHQRASVEQHNTETPRAEASNGN